MSLREAAQMALEALTYAWHEDEAHPESKAIIAALRDALAEAPSNALELFRERVEKMLDEEHKWLSTVAVLSLLQDCEQKAEAEKAEPVDEEVIGEYGWQGTSRQWWAGGTWLEPDDVVIVRRAAARGKG